MPTIKGTIDRRILVNLRVDADTIRQVLPDRFEPQLINGWAMAGICLIRLVDARPGRSSGAPSKRSVGIRSENAAHRIAVRTVPDDGRQSAVYVPRRDTSSRLAVMAGGQLFPGELHLAEFDVRESQDCWQISMSSRDRQADLDVVVRRSSSFPASSVFRDLTEASEFYRLGSVGYSATKKTNRFETLELETSSWTVEPLEVELLRSRFFDELPAGSIEFDNALLMTNIGCAWHPKPPIVEITEPQF